LVDLSDERLRIARELHDGIAQDLIAIGYNLDIEIGRSDTNPNSRAALRAIREQITEVNLKVRVEIFKLRSFREPIPQIQLDTALSSLAANFNLVGALPDNEIGLSLFKVLLELCRNAIEHGEAQNISLTITAEKIFITNDGLISLAIWIESHGLMGVNERLADIGWQLRIEKGFSHLELSQVP
jgi:NarL family two-component system sensor histidine kinase LiaS